MYIRRTRLEILNKQRDQLLEQWRTDKERKLEILTQIMDLDYEIAKETGDDSNVVNH